MRNKYLPAVLSLLAAALPAIAQEAPARPIITVGDFEYGTVASQFTTDKNTRKQLSKMGIGDSQALAAALGVGATDMLVEKLLAAGEFRVVERKRLASIRQEQGIASPAEDSGAALRGLTAGEPAARFLRARYIITGSVTRLGFEDKQLGGIAGQLASNVFLYGLNVKKKKTEVHLTARLIDIETGEIIASYTGRGESRKGGGISVGGMGSWGLGGGGGKTDNIRETAIGEATQRAATKLAELIVQSRAQMVSFSQQGVELGLR